MSPKWPIRYIFSRLSLIDWKMYTLYLSVCVTAGVYSPRVSCQALLSSVAPESYCSPPTFTIHTIERKRWQLKPIYFRNQKPPRRFCAEQTKTFLLVFQWSGSHHSECNLFWLLSIISGDAPTDCRIFCKCINKYLCLI